MKRDMQIGLSLALVAIAITSCTPLGAVTSILTTGIAGASYVREQTVERTFPAPMPEVKEACHRALKEMAFIIKEEDAHIDEHHIVAVASPAYEVEITITHITSNATKVTVNADSLLERDKATGEEIINQMTTVLSPPPPPVFAFPTVDEQETSQLLIDTGPQPIPQVEIVRPAPAQSPPHAAPPHVMAELASRANPPVANQDVIQVETLHVDGQDETVNLEQMYESGIRKYIQGDFPSATKHFRRYLAAQSDNGRTPQALYWLGESLYNQREYADALLQFETILRTYPRSPEVPRALFKGALTYRQLGQTHKAEALLETLITQHPTSREAQLAKATTPSQ
ncbi:MAG: DUF3568 family protein [Candidatus Methylomirabilales bacterium]